MKKSNLLIIIFIVTFCSQVHGQNDNYWSWKFNTSSVLLAGSVVSGSAYSSSVYYNPSLINDEMPSLAISASLMSFQFLDIENAVGQGLDIDKTLVRIQPRFLSKVLKTKNERIFLEVAFLSPASENVNFSIQQLDELNLIERTMGEEVYSGYIDYKRDYNDYYIGAGGSYKFNDKLHLGISSFVSVKTMKYQYQQDLSAFQETDSVEIGGQTAARYISQDNYSENLKYWDLSLIFKLGAQYELIDEKLNLGLNFTLPSIAIYGEGDIRIQNERSNVFDNNNDQFTSNYNDIEIGEKIRTKVKSPFSIALGFQFFLNEYNDFISITGEYFHSIQEYSLFSFENDSADLEAGQNGNLSQPFQTYSEALTNWSVGGRKRVNDKLNLLFGFRTDFKNKSNEKSIDDQYSNYNLGRITFDKYHFSIGPIFEMKSFNLITGLQYSWGRNSRMRNLVNMSDPVEYIPELDVSLQGLREDNASAKLNEISLFFGINFD